MHEYGLAADIVHGVQAEAAAQGGKRLATLEVEVGALARLETDTLSFWLAEELADHLDDPSIDADRIRVARAPLQLKCLRCGHEATIEAEDGDLVLLDPRDRHCPACGSEEVRTDDESGWQIRVDWEEDAPERGGNAASVPDTHRSDVEVPGSDSVSAERRHG